MLGALAGVIFLPETNSLGKVRILACFYSEKVSFQGVFRAEKVRDGFPVVLCRRKGRIGGILRGIVWGK